ncbi:MAG: cellulase family glycosylhydrolase [Clostridiales bacterium]|jgi:hypothetical protein|nr:cellulase family glycosylhydrolase [Clostridiales bacterium]
MKRILKKYIFLLSSVLLLTPVNIHANNEEYSVIVNEKKISFDDTSGKPMIIEGRMYVPLRIMGDLLGVDTDWDESSKSITFRRDDIIIQLRIGNPIALINGKEVHIEEGFATVPIMQNGRTYVPARFIAESMGGSVEFDNGITYITTGSYIEVNQPITPWKYQSLLGKGMDVDWSKTTSGKENYSIQAVKDFKEQGISHVRIRIKDPANDELFIYLDQQIQDCLENGIIPIIAYQGDDLKNNPTEKNIKKVVDWWSTIAKRYKDYSHLLSFDVLIEVTDALSKEPDKLNEVYERVVAEIRKTNPTRIIMISPRLRSDAAYLKELKIPSQHNNYLMAEWHFYASGPSKENPRKLWTVGTNEEKNLINEKINLALQWQKETGIPTWVGAWMPSNYNDGNDYTVLEQVVFSQYMTEQLMKAGIPFAVNSDTKFYDREKNNWISEMIPVRDMIWNKN